MMDTGKSIDSFDIEDVSAGCNYSDDITALTKNQSPDSMNVEFFNGRIRKRLGSLAVSTPPSGQGGIDVNTKLMLHCDGVDASTVFTDSETTPKTITATGNARITTVQSKFGGASGVFYGAGIDASTKLMLHMDDVGLTDSEFVPKTTTLNGAITRSATQSKFGGFSASFDGLTQYISLADSADWFFDVGDFTIDFWMYPTLSQAGCLFSQYVSGSDRNYFILEADGSLFWQYTVGGVDIAIYSSDPGVVTVNSWQHVALVRSGSSAKLFINGVSVTFSALTPIGSSSLSDLAAPFNLGTVAGNFYTGYIDEFRVSKGVARWTSNFIVPVLAYTTGDYLSVATSTDFNFSTNAFTFDTWVRFLGTGNQSLFSQNYSFGGDTKEQGLYFSSDNHLIFYSYFNNGGGYQVIFNCSFTPVVGTWYHIALVRVDSSNAATGWRIFVNGVSQMLTLSTGSWNIALISSTAPLLIGYDSNFSYSLTGYLDEIRLSNIARWNSDFTPPVLPYDTFVSSITPIGFSVVDFSNTSGYHQQVAHLGSSVYAYDRVTSTKITLRTGAPYVRSYNARASAYLIQTYNDYSIPYYWDGVASAMAVLSNNAPHFKRAIEFQGYLIGMNTASAKTRCYYQPIGNILGGGAAYTDFFTLTPAPNDDEISDSFLLNGRLYAGTKYGIFRISFVGGVTVFEFKQVISDTGIVPDTVCTVITKQFGQVALFLGTDKRVYMFDGANVKAISDLFYYHNDDTPISLDLIDDNYKENSFAIYDSIVKIYRLFVTKKSQSKNYYCMNIDVDTFAYYPFDNMQFSAGCIGYDRLLRPYVICTDYLGSLKKLFVQCNTDSGVEIDEYYTSPLVSVKSQMVKQAQTIDMSFVPSSNAKLVVEARVDYRRQWEEVQRLPLADTKDKFLGSSFVLNSAPLGSQRSVCYSHISLATSFNCYQFRIYSDTPTAKRWEIFDMNVNQTVLKFGKAEAIR